MDLLDRAWSVSPEDSENFQFSICWLWELFPCHNSFPLNCFRLLLEVILYESYRIVKKKNGKNRIFLRFFWIKVKKREKFKKSLWCGNFRPALGHELGPNGAQVEGATALRITTSIRANPIYFKLIIDLSSVLQRRNILFFWQALSCCQFRHIRVAKFQSSRHRTLALSCDAVIARPADLANQAVRTQQP